MVPNLNDYKSHPNKALEVHINSVTNKALKRYASPIVKWAALFHDLGKLNPNFQKKLSPAYKGEYSGYDEHAYLSAWSWLCFLEKNGKTHLQLRQDFNDDIIKLQIVLVLIAKHHGNLPNFEKILNEDPLERLHSFIKSHADLPLSSFLEKKLFTPHNSFQLPDGESKKIDSICPKR